MAWSQCADATTGPGSYASPHLPADPGKPFGLVIDWAHTNSGGGLVLHNHRIDTRVLGSRLLWISKYGQLVLEPLNVLLDSIDNAAPGGKGWQPEFCDAV